MIPAFSDVATIAAFLLLAAIVCGQQFRINRLTSQVIRIDGFLYLILRNNRDINTPSLEELDRHIARTYPDA